MIGRSHNLVYDSRILELKSFDLRPLFTIRHLDYSWVGNGITRFAFFCRISEIQKSLILITFCTRHLFQLLGADTIYSPSHQRIIFKYCQVFYIQVFKAGCFLCFVILLKVPERERYTFGIIAWRKMRLLRFAALSKWFQRGAPHLAGSFASMGYFCLCSNCSNSRRDHPWKLPRWSVKLYAVYKASFELPLFPPPFSSVFITTSYLSLLLLFSSPMLGNFPLSPTFYPAPYASLSVQKHCKDL